MTTPGTPGRWSSTPALAALVLLALATGVRGDHPAPVEVWLPRLQPGMWIKVEGRLDPAGGLRAREVKVLHGERDESEITTGITALDPDGRSFRTPLGIQVETNSRTAVESAKKTRSSFSALRVGDLIEAEGQFQKNGTLLADEIEIKKRERDRAEDEDEEITGRIESVDVSGRKVVVLGISIYLDEKTKNKSPYPE